MTDDTPAFDARSLIEAANACYAKARDQALPPSVRAKFARAADALVAAVDAHHEATAPPAQRIGGYDNDRCRSCGRVWELHTIDCANDSHRPIERPEWLDKAVAAEAEATLLRNGTVSDLRAGANGERVGSATMNGGLSDK